LVVRAVQLQNLEQQDTKHSSNHNLNAGSYLQRRLLRTIALVSQQCWLIKLEIISSLWILALSDLNITRVATRIKMVTSWMD